MHGAQLSNALGFITVVEHAEHGIFGGYLLLNQLGRPLEFHCTAPLKPSRAQQILYGPTLKPYLYGEQIAQALISAASCVPVVLCTDQLDVLAVRPLKDIPIALWLPREECLPASGANDKAPDSHIRFDSAHGLGTNMHTFAVGHHALAVAAGYATDCERLTAVFAPLGPEFDLREPFGRIREALAEVQRSGR